MQTTPHRTHVTSKEIRTPTNTKPHPTPWCSGVEAHGPMDSSKKAQPRTKKPHLHPGRGHQACGLHPGRSAASCTHTYRMGPKNWQWEHGASGSGKHHPTGASLPSVSRARGLPAPGVICHLSGATASPLPGYPSPSVNHSFARQRLPSVSHLQE